MVGVAVSSLAVATTPHFCEMQETKTALYSDEVQRLKKYIAGFRTASIPPSATQSEMRSSDFSPVLTQKNALNVVPAKIVLLQPSSPVRTIF